MVMPTWRRNPPGALAQTLANRRHWPMTASFMALEDDEFVEMMKVEGASDRMIADELEKFRELKGKKKQTTNLAKQRRQARRERSAPEAMDPYVEAEIRRLGGVVADDILREMQ